MPIETAKYCPKCGQWHIPSFVCTPEEEKADKKEEKVEETPVVEDAPVVDEAPVVEDAPVEEPVVEEETVVENEPVAYEEVAEAIDAVIDAVADGDVTPAEKGEVLSQLDDVKPTPKKTSRKKKTTE